PENSSVQATIQVASLDSNHAERDKHLRGDDFLDVDEYPTATFKSTKIEKTGEKTAKITGDFTLHGVTKPVTLDAK
ncbi:YceI family protein, partial [Alcanivorax sp. HI0033]